MYKPITNLRYYNKKQKKKLINNLFPETSSNPVNKIIVQRYDHNFKERTIEQLNEIIVKGKLSQIILVIFGGVRRRWRFGNALDCETAYAVVECNLLCGASEHLERNWSRVRTGTCHLDIIINHSVWITSRFPPALQSRFVSLNYFRQQSVSLNSCHRLLCHRQFYATQLRKLVCHHLR